MRALSLASASPAQPVVSGRRSTYIRANIVQPPLRANRRSPAAAKRANAHAHAMDEGAAAAAAASGAGAACADPGAPCWFDMGPGTLRVCRKELHGGARANVAARMRAAAAALGAAADTLGVALLKGGDALPVYATDGEVLFRQDAYFFYLFGVVEEGFWGAIDLRDGGSVLFMPRLPESYAVWMGPLHGPDHFRAKYAVDRVHYLDELPSVLAALAPPCVHVLRGTNTDSGAAVAPPDLAAVGVRAAGSGSGSGGGGNGGGSGAEAGFEVAVEESLLFPAITEARVHKSAAEVAVLRHANRVGSKAHVAMMGIAAPGKFEYQLESLFKHVAYSQGGCRHQGYTPIAASGPNGAVLHYGHAGAPNARRIEKDDMLLLDMGCEYHRYTSDITTSFPASGRFRADQRLVYEAVLDAHASVLAALRPGVSWPDMQTLAYSCILGGLKRGGLLEGAVGEMLAADVGALFMPHGLGHFLGLDTHDVGGYGPGLPPRPERPGYRSLRTARTLEPGMVITVEPGCYFNPALLRPALADAEKSKFLNAEALERFMSFGGVRLEDNVVITDGGAESLTDVPRRVADVEAVMAGAPWPRPGK